MENVKPSTAFRALALQVSCYLEDMISVEQAQSTYKLPFSLWPEEAKQLMRLYNKENSTAIHDAASEKGVRICQVHRGPDLVRLGKGGYIRASTDQTAIIIAIPIPKSKEHKGSSSESQTRKTSQLVVKHLAGCPSGTKAKIEWETGNIVQLYENESLDVEEGEVTLIGWFHNTKKLTDSSS